MSVIAQRGRVYYGNEPDLGPIDLEQSLIGMFFMFAGYLVYKLSNGENPSSLGMSLSIILWVTGFFFCITLINGIFVLASGLYAVGFVILVLAVLVSLLFSKSKK